MQPVLQGKRKHFFEIHNERGCFEVRAFGAAADQSNDEVSANSAHVRPIAIQWPGTDESGCNAVRAILMYPDNPFG